MKLFSHRKGLKPVRSTIQTEGMDEELRNSLWNVLYNRKWSSISSFTQGYQSDLHEFARSYWAELLKRPTDVVTAMRTGVLFEKIRSDFLDGEWNETYDFLEFAVHYFKNEPGLVYLWNSILERELAGYRIISGEVTPITDEQEVAALEEALADSRFKGVQIHLKSALELLSDRKNPDPRNSIKDSISAVESICQIITGDDKATLGRALEKIGHSHDLHEDLVAGFKKLYGYTSDGDGIRHALLEEHNLTVADAKFFLLSCTSFINYLKSKME